MQYTENSVVDDADVAGAIVVTSASAARSTSALRAAGEAAAGSRTDVAHAHADADERAQAAVTRMVVLNWVSECEIVKEWCLEILRVIDE